MIRIGHGFDVHRFGGAGPLVIGGVQVPYEHGFIAHSDGDVAIHALCDALLGALALGDIGQHFPDTDPAYAGIDSQKLLQHVYQLVQKKQFSLVNLDLTIVAQTPKMGPHIPAMRQQLAQCLQAELEQINVKATTTENLGYTGRREGIAAHCVVLLERSC